MCVVEFHEHNADIASSVSDLSGADRVSSGCGMSSRHSSGVTTDESDTESSEASKPTRLCADGMSSVGETRCRHSIGVEVDEPENSKSEAAGLVDKAVSFDLLSSACPVPDSGRFAFFMGLCEL